MTEGCQDSPGDGARATFQCHPVCLAVLAGQGTWQRYFPVHCFWAALGLVVFEVAVMTSA